MGFFNQPSRQFNEESGLLKGWERVGIEDGIRYYPKDKVFDPDHELNEEQYQDLVKQKTSKVDITNIEQSDEDPLGTKFTKQVGGAVHNLSYENPEVFSGLKATGQFIGGAAQELKSSSPTLDLLMTISDKGTQLSAKGAQMWATGAETRLGNLPDLNIDPTLAGFAGGAAFEIVKDIGISSVTTRLLNNLNSGGRGPLNYAYATVGTDGTFPNIIDDADILSSSSKPLQMSIEEGVEHYEDIRARTRHLGSRAADKDAVVTRIGRLHKRDELHKLTPRELKGIKSTHIDSDAVRFVEKYHGGEILKAQSHHILDVDFWGRALDTKHGDIVSDVLFQTGSRAGNEGSNLVYAWAGNRGIDHDLMHKMYKLIPARQHVEKLMANGQWSKLSAKAQAKMLKEVSYDQYRITNNFYRLKLATIKREFPELMKMNPVHLRRHIIKHPEKYAKIRVGLMDAAIDHKNTEHVKGMFETLQQLPYTGGTTDELKIVFGLETPKAGAIKYFGSSVEKDFNTVLPYLLNKASKKVKK